MIQLINDLQVIGLDQLGNWVLGLVSLKIHDDKYSALYTEYRHGSNEHHFSQKYKGVIVREESSLNLIGLGKLLPHDGFTTYGELILSTRNLREMRTITMKDNAVSPHLEIMLRSFQKMR